MAREVEVGKETARASPFPLAARFAAFVAERHPFALAPAVAAFEAVCRREPGRDRPAIEALRPALAEALRRQLGGGAG